MRSESTPDAVDAGTGATPPEWARAETLARLRAALAVAVLAEPQGRTACLRILEPLVHHGRLRRTALLLERPVPVWVEGHVLALHARAGCRRRAVDPPLTHPPELREALNQLPWSGEWLVLVADRMLGPAVADEVRGTATRWVAERNAFIEAHAGLVRYIVNRHGAMTGVPRADLIQEASLALCRAVERFDPERGVRFSSYAVPVIRHAIAQYVRRMGFRAGSLSPARPLVIGVSSPHTLPTNGTGTLGPPAALALDAPFEDGESLGERLADTETPGPDVAAALALAREGLRDALRALPAEVAEIVVLHWGLDGGARRSLPAVARQVGRAPAEVRQAIRDALGVLQRRVAASFEGQGTPRVQGGPRILPRLSGSAGPAPVPGRSPGGWVGPRMVTQAEDSRLYPSRTSGRGRPSGWVWPEEVWPGDWEAVSHPGRAPNLPRAGQRPP